MQRPALQPRALLVCLPLLLLLFVPLGHTSVAQDASTQNGSALNVTVRNVGVSIGDSAYVTGLRLNDRDRRLKVVNGVNLTLWRPHDEGTGTVHGLALGLPLTGAQHLRGVGIGVGIGTTRSLHGLGVAPVGLGSGKTLRGVAVGGLGIGAGRHLHGIGIGGLGVGAGENTTGIFVGGLGAGAGDHAQGVLIGGLGAGAGDAVSGILVGGLGAGAGDEATGLLIGGLGAGTGDDATGLVIGGVGAGAGDSLTGVGFSLGGVGAGDRLQGLAVGGLGVGAGEQLHGLAVAGGGIGSTDITGLSIAGGYTRIENGRLHGAAIAAWNDSRGSQHGVTIGLYNYTRELHGLQLGLLNVARNNPRWAMVLPGLNLNL